MKGKKKKDRAEFMPVLENLSSNVQKLKDAGYVEVTKSFVDNRPQTWVKLTNVGREAYREYRTGMLNVLECLPD